MGTKLSPKKGHSPPPHFSAHVYCGQKARWMKMPLGMDVDLGPGHTVLDGTQLPSKAPNFRPMCIVAKRSPILATAEDLFKQQLISS